MQEQGRRTKDNFTANGQVGHEIVPAEGGSVGIEPGSAVKAEILDAHSTILSIILCACKCG